MTPPEVRERLIAIGVDLSAYANDLAVIHTVLKRLHASGELRIFPRAGGGKNAYQWNNPPRVIAIEKDVADLIAGRRTVAKRSK
jgi:hypothetical protein